MKKLHYLFAMMLIATGLASCSDEPKTPAGDETATLSGLYIVNNGNMSANIPSSITAYDYASGSLTSSLEDAFEAANGVKLGEGAQPAIIHGSKMYIPLDISNIIWVVDAKTLKIIKMITPEAPASLPRYLVADGGKVYASMFSGYVCRIDTASLSIDKTLRTDPNSEQMAIADGKLYVANSDGYNYTNGYADCSISIIDLASFTETSKIKDTKKVLNPTDMATNGHDVFALCKGDYATVPSMVKKIEGTDVKDIAEATFIAANNDNLYVINNPYGVAREDWTFKTYDTSTLKLKGDIVKQASGSRSWIEYPSCIKADPVSGDIVILSYFSTEEGYAQYREPCYANIYDKDGNFKERISCGVGALGVTFVHNTGK